MPFSTSVLARLDDSQRQVTVDRRRDVRHQATYRPCCVIVSDRVVMGLIRNYSAGGAKIEVDVELKVGDRISYFWEANSCIEAEIVWRDGKAYGLDHIDRTSKPTKEFPTRSVRVPCKADAACWINNEVHTALVENISFGGMRVRGLPNVEPGTLLSIVFCGLELNAVSVRWSNDGSAGLRFPTRLTREMLTQLLLDERFGLSSIAFGTEHSK